MTTSELAPRRPVRKTIGGVTFDDPFAWLGEESDEALAWQWAQDQRAQDTVRTEPMFAELVQRITPYLRDVTESFGSGVKAGGRWFLLGTNDAGTAQALRVTDDPADAGRQLVDAGELTAQGDGRMVQLLHPDPSPDGSLVAFMTMSGGDMFGSLRVADAATGELLDVTVPILPFNLPRPGWLPKADGLFVHRRGAAGEHQMVLVSMRDGSQRTTTFTAADVAPSAPGLVPQVSPGGRWVVAVTVPHEHTAVMIGDIASGEWRRFVPPSFVGECYGDWIDDDNYLAVLIDEACSRGRVVIIPAATSSSPDTWREVVPASDAVLKSVVVLGDQFALAELVDVNLGLRLFRLDGTGQRIVDLPLGSASPDFVAPPRLQPRSEELSFAYRTFTRPSVQVRLDPVTASLVPIGSPPEELAGMTTAQHFATSADGTRVPYWVVQRADLDRTRPHPALVSAYGGFNFAWAPSFLHHLVPFVEAGGVYVHACLRGGSEYGREWYEAGRRRNKQHTFDDLRAVAAHLIETGVSSAELLAFEGESNGGLTAGAAIAQQPDLWRVVVPFVPLFDILEPLGDVPGAEAVRSYYLEDYGNPNDPDDAAAIAAYSPYHNVADGTAYPSVFCVFGETDVGCPPFHGRKFVARLQHATSSGRPLLLRVWRDVGHGSIRTEVSIEQHAEWLTFVMTELGMTLPPR